MHLSGGIKIFSTQEMVRIHGAAMDLLETTGLEMQLSDGALERLADQGLRVDFATRRVRFPTEPVLETIRQLSGAPIPEISDAGTAKPPQPLRQPTRLRAHVGANCGFVYDVALGTTRPATHQDMADFIMLKRSLPDVIQSGPGLYPQDVPQTVASIHAAAAAVKYCGEPGAPDVRGVEDLVWIERVMQAAGIWGPEQHKTVAIYPVSPLRMAGRGAEMMEWQAARGDLSFVIGMVIPGASSPITPAAQTVIVLAEEFGFNTAFRLLVAPPNNRFSPRSIGDDVCIMDMRTGAHVTASPEVALLRLATHQMAGEFYKFPGHSDHGIRFFTDAKEPGIQAGMEGALMAMADLAMGVYSYDEEITCNVGILGLVGSALSMCLEQAVIDHDLFRFLQHFVRGTEVSDETIALDLIHEIGPGGSFLDSAHTVRHLREETWFPELWHRGPWDAWVASGRRSPLELAHGRVEEILKQKLEPVLDDERIRDVDRVVEEAEFALLGSTTGILP